MPFYRIRFADSQGKRFSRIVAADSRSAVAELIHAEGRVLISAEETASPKGKRPSAAFILELTQTLSLLAQAGLDIRQSLEIAGTLFPDSGKKSGSTVAALSMALDRGESFSMAASNQGFPSIYTGLIKIGERTGSMSAVLPAMAAYLKSRKEMRDKFINAMLYPSLVLTAVLLGIIILSIVAVPRMGEILAGFGSSPEMTAAMELRMQVSIIAGGLITGGLVISTMLWLLLRSTSRQFRIRTDKLIISLPLIGSAVTLQETVNIVFALEVLTSAGISLEDALEQAAPVSANTALSGGLIEVREKIVQGDRPSQAFRSSGVFPERMIRWLALGESTGKVEEVFSGLKTWYQGEFETFLTRITGLAEPVLIIVTGLLLLAGIVILVLPLLSGFGNLF